MEEGDDDFGVMGIKIWDKYKNLGNMVKMFKLENKNIIGIGSEI